MLINYFQGNKLRLIRPQNPATVRGAFTQFIQNGARMPGKT